MNILKPKKASVSDVIGGLLIFIGLSLLVRLFSELLGFAVVLAANYDKLSLESLSQMAENPFVLLDSRLLLLTVQFIAASLLFVVYPYFYVRLYEKSSVGTMISVDSRAKTAFLALFITLAIIPANAFLVEWNKGIEFPAFLEGFATWAKSVETTAEQLTKKMVAFENLFEFFFCLVVIALIPAVGEELFFRGVMQYKLFQLFRNHHVAIWVTAAIFSAFHLQFFGFFPRMLLGVVFGYLYVWSGNLLVPILGHFTNNGLAMMMLHLAETKKIGVATEDLDKMPIWVSIASAIVSLVLIMIFRKTTLEELKKMGEPLPSA